MTPPSASSSGTQHATPRRVRWTRSQCDAMREAGILVDRYELIDGDVLSMRGATPAHAVARTMMVGQLVGVYGAQFVRPTGPIALVGPDADYNEPEPSAAVTLVPCAEFWERHPGPHDLALVVEISDGAPDFHLGTKARLYARAGIEEYWVVELRARELVVHRNPAAKQYGEVVAYFPEERASPLSQPNSSILVSSLLPTSGA